MMDRRFLPGNFRMYSARLLLVLLILFSAAPAVADWKSLLKGIPGVSSDDAQEALDLSQAEIADGLKEALDRGAEIAVTALSQEGGYLDNPAVSIPLPDSLDWIEKGLRRVGREDLAEDFITTMNRAAEEAVPVALAQLQSAIEALTLEDAQAILSGPDDAATQYFRKHSESSLQEQFLPIVEKTTADTGVTSAYKEMTKYAGGLTSLFDTDDLDIDQYVTEEALDGLFKMIAIEEARIREDPVARSTDLLKKVFGQ
jgi:hypothetical protein